MKKAILATIVSLLTAQAQASYLCTVSQENAADSGNYTDFVQAKEVLRSNLKGDILYETESIQIQMSLDTKTDKLKVFSFNKNSELPMTAMIMDAGVKQFTLVDASRKLAVTCIKPESSN